MPDAAASSQHSQQGPGQLVFVTGTGTGVGKTWVTAALARLLRGRGLDVAACKPLQSHEAGAAAESTDAAVLAAATGQRPNEVCAPQHSFPVPLAPPMAARALGRSCPSIEQIAAGCGFAAGTDVGFVEGVGGLYSPLACDGHNLDLIERLAPDLVIVVASAELGGIHDTTAATVPLAHHRHAVILNRLDPGVEIHRLNLDWLRGAGLQVAASVSELAVIVSTALRP